jgi:endoglucanase Acf2
MRPPCTLFLLAFPLLIPAVNRSGAADPIVHQGAGSYTTALPPGAKAPPETIYRTDNVQGKTPTNDWCSSLAWMKYSERQYPHPLAVQAEPGGLRIYYLGANITANRDAVFGFMPPGNGDDLILGHSAQDEFPDARLDGFSDWFVTARFASGPRSMTVSYGHGSPFVYALYEGGDARVRFAKPPKVWFGDEQSPMLGVTINGKHYGLFGPTGSTWTGLKDKTLTNHSETRHYFSVAVLPDDAEETLSLFKRYAYSHVTDTRVEWAYDPKTSAVATTFTFQTVAREGKEEGTLFALYPHQWRNAGDLHYVGEYPSVRGKMKLAEGASFRATMTFPGVLPALPNVGGADKQRLAAYVKEEVDAAAPGITDTYADGKWMGKLATLIPIAEQYQLDDAVKALSERLRKRLEEWFTAQTADGKAKDRGLFYYDENWGALIGCPAAFGSDAELNDHHFHYGYFLRAAAEVARRDPAWAKDQRWGGMVQLLIRDIATPDRKDPLFPFLRNFDPYAGHSWASGHARFGDGNNQESSSEAMNAWTGLILWGEATHDAKLRDLGIYLYTTEMNAIDEYWFDVHGDNFPKGYTPSVVTMVWGGKGANGTWFSARPEHIHGINWLPIHGGSLYLGRWPAYAEKNYAALLHENGGTNWAGWADVIWMYRALVDAPDAIKQFEAAKDKTAFDGGDSKAHVFHWIYSLNELGQVDADVTADTPLYAVFHKGKLRTYCIYNEADEARTVVFSDGFRLKAEGKGFVTGTGEK